MKRVLLVTYVFPPAPSPGAQRPGYLARYLPQFGWNVTVLTNTAEPPPFPARVVSVGKASRPASIAPMAGAPNSPLRVMLRGLREMVLFPDTTALWMPPAIKAGMALLQEQPFDAIMSTALPPSVHVVAWILAKKRGLPWIADYRDPWGNNPYGWRRGPVRRSLEGLLERGMIHRAGTLTTISEPIAAQLRGFHKRDDVHIIPNAFDPAEWEGVPDTRPQRFDLCFTGSMYDGKQRNPDVLFEALAQLRAENDPSAAAARVHFYGPNSSNVNESAARYGLSLQVREHGPVPRPSALLAQRSSAALLIFLNMDPATGKEMGSKYLEYLGARRPILAIGPNTSIMRDFIDRTGTGWFASDVEECKTAIRRAYETYLSGNFEARRDTSAVPTAGNLARRFADVLDGAVSQSPLRGIA